MPNRSTLVLLLAMLLGACSSSDDSGAGNGDGSERGGANGGNSAPRLSLAGASVAEGDSGTTTLQFSATLNAATDKTVTVKYRTQDGTAEAGQDYAEADGQIAFAPGTTQQFIDVIVHGDTAVETDEALTVQLFAATHAQLTGTTAEGHIVNDDRPVVSVADAESPESGSLSFTVTITPAAPGPISFDYATADGSARAGTDYSETHGRLTVPAGAQSAEIVVPLTADEFDENDETFTLGLSNPEQATLGNALATGTIRDDDDSDLLRIGAAKRPITPTQAQIDGVEEPRAFGGGTHLQKFNLGGFGINPMQNTPDPLGDQVGEALTEPASQRVFTNSAQQLEHTWIRALAIQQPGGDTVVLLMMDAVGAGNIIQKGVKAAVIAAAAEAGVTLAPENILFGQTHTHAGADLQGLWGGVPQQWINQVLYPAAADAVREALAARLPARLSLRQGHTNEFNNYRRPRINPAIDADGTLTLLRATADDGTPIGSVLQYNAHPTSVNVGGNRIPHADYILGAMEWLEDRNGGTALYFNGPIADASGSSGRAGCAPVAADQPYSAVRCRGEGMADYLLNPANALAARELAPTVTARSVEAYLPVTNPGFLAFGLTGTFNRYYNFMDVATDSIPGIEPYLAELPQLTPVARTHVSRITLGGTGGLEIVTIPGEATGTFGDYIRSLAGTNVMLLGLTHNSFGYIIPEEEFGYVDQTGDAGLVAPFTGYEENVSLGPLTAPLLRTQAYNVLFDAAPEANVPPTLSACMDDQDSPTCIAQVLENRASLLLASLQVCVEQGVAASGCPFRETVGYLDPVFEGLASGFDALAEGCRDMGGPDEMCDAFAAAGAAAGNLPHTGIGDGGGAGEVVNEALENAQTLPGDVQASVEQTADNAANGTLAERRAEPVVMEGRAFPDWSQPAATGLANPYPSGVGGDGDALTGGTPFYVRDAHNGQMLYPPAGFAGLPTAAPVGEIAAFRFENGAWVEIPVQVDERFPYFLANANSGFSFYSGTDMELTYAWDRETWDASGQCHAEYPAAMPDPVPGLDDDDEIVFMADDAGEQAPADAPNPAGTTGGQQIALADPLAPGAPKFVYLFRREGGSSFSGAHYVEYTRDANANQWVDRSFWASSDPEKLGTSNTGYGPNLSGTVCPDGTAGSAKASTDRFPRDGMTVTTDKYKVYASGRWMVRNVHIAKPGEGNEGNYGADIVDRWKGRAFQQSPDSTVSLVGFEDEQVNWEANSALLGERAGPVRAIREIWGADSGTNVTKTETYYRDAYVYRFRARVHPIPPDGLYTSWDYNRNAMVPAPGENVPGGRYYTAIRGNGVPIDGLNDDVGQVDGHAPVGGYCITSDGPQPAADFGGTCPLFFDTGDPALNLPLTMYNWEQIAAKGDLGSLVYMFELKSATIGANAVAMPYYRDDACLDDGTGDDPVQRPWPGESYRWNDGAVPKAYTDLDGNGQVDCHEKQGAHAQHGIHFFAPPESDNAMMPVPVDEIDGQQWAFAVPMDEPTNVGERYANVVRVPLVKAVTPRPAADGGSTLDALLDGANTLISGIVDLLIGDDASVLAVVQDVAGSPEDADADLAEGVASLVDGITPAARGRIFAGVGVVDMTPDVGYGAGQYADKGIDTPGGDADPYATHKTQVKSYGVASRLTARAIVIEGANGKRVALLKSDNYLAQDNLLRRVGQVLAEQGSTIRYDQILYGVTHAHSTTYVATASAGVWVFQDAYDARFFENQARKLAQAILDAERALAPARLGATTVRHKTFKGNIMGPATGDDGTPVQYPSEYGDHGLVVMRIETDEAQPQPIAVWVNWGEHPEGLDGYDLHSADYVAYLERFVERDLGAPLVFSQGDVGSAEKSGNDQQRLRDDATVCEGPGADGAGCAAGEGTWRDWNHKGYVQNERNVRYLADAVVKGWRVIGGEQRVDAAAPGVPPNNYVPEVQVPLSNAFPVDYRNAWVPGPLSHPYPAVSGCRTESTVAGDPGVPNAADCTRPGFPGFGSAQVWDTMKAEGLPVPENYDLPSFGALEENNRLKLQVVRLGDMVLGSCACEAQVDLILNFESRANDVAGDIYDGFDWACVAEDKGQIAADPAYAQACALQRERHFDVAEFPTHMNGSLADAAKVARMRAQVHNDAAGWDAPEYVPYANAEPADPAQIKGNFTKEELPAARGYKLAVGLGHAGDYNGYTVSYREFMSHDHYRKALTAYGPHTADYMVTRLVRMAGAMKGAPELAPEPHDVTAEEDEARQVAYTQAHGAATSGAFDAFHAALAPEAGAPHALAQPADIGTFTAATFSWQGGSTAVDNPRVVVERLVDGQWTFFADQTGEVQTRVQWPTWDQLPLVYLGQFEWRWTANFEAYESFPARLGGTPAGVYRFAVDGCFNDGVGDALAADACRGAASAYSLVSEAFAVIDAAEVVQDVQADLLGDLAIRVSATSIPRTYTSVFPFVRDDNGSRYCKECSFRPWAAASAGVESVRVDVAGASVAVSGAGADWSADANLLPGDSATITVRYTDGRIGRPYTFIRH